MNKPVDIKKLVSNLDLQNYSGEVEEVKPKEISEKDIDFVNYIFDSLVGIFPSLTTTGNSDQSKAMRRELVEGILLNNINSREQIDQGLNYFRIHGGTFCPSTAEFMRACLGSNLISDDLAIKYLTQVKTYHSFVKMPTKFQSSFSYLIIQLHGLINWEYMKIANDKGAIAHCKKIYGELMSSGYQEPIITDSVRVETAEVIKPRQTELQREQEFNRKMRHDGYIKFREKLKLAKRAAEC